MQGIRTQYGPMLQGHQSEGFPRKQEILGTFERIISVVVGGRGFLPGPGRMARKQRQYELQE